MKLTIILSVLVSFSIAKPQFLPQLSKVTQTASGISKNVPQVNQAVSKVSETASNIKEAIPDIKLTDALLKQFDSFKNEFQKSYKSVEEETLRRSIVLQNQQKILDFNKQFADQAISFTQRLNEFSDLTLAEFSKRFNGFRKIKTNVPIPTPRAFTPPAKAVVPEQIDWREIGGVTSAKNQGVCASCWAFSAIGALEGQIYQKTKRTVELSPQNLLDCTYPDTNEACEGGLVEPAYEYVKKNSGVNPETSYNYEGVQKTCRYNKESIGDNSTVQGFVRLPVGDERALEVAVGTIGPMSGVMQADLSSFQNYHDGIYYDPECKNDVDSMNHAILIVGYGKESDGQKYWIVKNSYSPKWGKDGYFKIAKDRNNHCGIATQASYPIL